MGWWGLLTVSCPGKHWPGQCPSMWDDRLPCWCRPFLEVRARQDWSGSLHPPVDMKYLPWHPVERGGWFHKKFRWHLQTSSCITQQTSAESFSLDRLPASAGLSALLGSSLSFSFLLYDKEMMRHGLKPKIYTHSKNCHSITFHSVWIILQLFCLHCIAWQWVDMTSNLASELCMNKDLCLRSNGGWTVFEAASHLCTVL